MKNCNMIKKDIRKVSFTNMPKVEDIAKEARAILLERVSKRRQRALCSLRVGPVVTFVSIIGHVYTYSFVSILCAFVGAIGLVVLSCSFDRFFELDRYIKNKDCISERNLEIEQQEIERECGLTTWLMDLNNLRHRIEDKETVIVQAALNISCFNDVFDGRDVKGDTKLKYAFRTVGDPISELIDLPDFKLKEDTLLQKGELKIDYENKRIYMDSIEPEEEQDE